MITFDHLQQALNLPDFDGFSAQMGMSPAGRERMLPKADKPPRQSAVLVLVYPDDNRNLQILLTKRTSTLRGHSGQISFPGGSQDDTDTSYEHTALRETCEEVGICEQASIHIIGRLTKMWIPPSNFEVHPIVGTLSSTPSITPSPDEVAAVLHLSVDALLDDMTKKTTQMQFRGTTFDVPYYDVEGHVVWGATAGMLSELEQRLKIVVDT